MSFCLSEEEEEEDMSKFSKSNVSEEIEKGNAAKNQLGKQYKEKRGRDRHNR